ncbi:MAG TPA: hypothetical protein VFP84_31430 [Kofleriaceae bacterium]|nr:hypothetical protein [Kofleriaceae bacterium]
MTKFDRLKKQNVRSSEPRKEVTDLSLDKLRQVTGGCAYAHVGKPVFN